MSGAQDAHQRYLKYVPDRYNGVLKWFHNSRVNSFKELVDTGGTALSIGCGYGALESQLLDDFDEIYGLEPVEDRISVAKDKGITGITGAAPPITFDDDSLDAIFALGTMEHVQDEQGLVEEASRTLRKNGTFYATLPIEVGIGGLIRHLGRCVVSPHHKQSPEDWRRFVDYSIEELAKKTPRDKHDCHHRYYNYKYAIEDIKRNFGSIKVEPWPCRYTGTINLILMVKANTPS